MVMDSLLKKFLKSEVKVIILTRPICTDWWAFEYISDVDDV